MLVLTRKHHESILIADNIVVTILEVKGNRVRIGIEADRHIDVRRMENTDRANDLVLIDGSNA